MFFISSLFLALLLSPILFFFHKRRKQPNLPPSPFKLPILGNLHQLGSSPHRSLHALSQKHGPLMFLHMGLSPTLIVSSRGAAEEIMKTHDLIFSSRPSSFMAQKLLYGKDVAFAPYDEYWRQTRKICIVELLSSKRVEAYRTVREDEIMNMMKKISSPSSSSQLGLVNLSELLGSLTNDIICRVALGKKYSQIEGEDGGSGNGSRFKRLLEEFTELLGSFYVGDFIPSLAWIGRLCGLVERAEKNSREWDDLLEGIIKDHEDGKRETVDGNVKDFVDVLLRVQKDTSFGLPLTKDHIKALILDMFAAGTDTTYTAIEWMMAELLRNPKVMKKVQEELRGIAVGNSMFTEDMLHQMNYLKSVIKETMRLHPPIPLLVPRESTKSSKIYGYDIPAKTRVIVNAWATGRDPISWEDPDKFQPERFVDGANKSHVDFRGHDFELIPFGAGRRICPGIHFAMSTVECTLANLLHRFDWKMPDGVDIDMDEGHGLTIRKKTPLILVPTPCFP
ncbi:hypothetical protein MRB53_001135 [Persea americana]|uniref:Uncharacterized protein n=1 Tax=Persea americana TaxID=3435 RepID=A0ACC2MQU2_PERAE|nr:hypothetical protein MRB53_001135 [Persea americana]